MRKGKGYSGSACSTCGRQRKDLDNEATLFIVQILSLSTARRTGATGIALSFSHRKATFGVWQSVSASGPRGRLVDVNVGDNSGFAPIAAWWTVLCWRTLPSHQQCFPHFEV